MSRTPARLQSPLTYAAVGASVLAVPASAAAVGAAPRAAGSSSAIKAKLKRHRIGYGGKVVVDGVAPASDQGETATLEYSSSSSGAWQQIASAPIRSDGHFRLVAWLRRSGWVMAAASGQASSARVATARASSNTASSAPERVAVAAAIRVRPRAINELRVRPIELRGELVPSGADRKVVLQADRNGKWVTVSGARTDSRGRFTLRYRPSSSPGQTALRVRFAGDSSNAATSRDAGNLTVYRQSVASWYYDGGATACGFHARFGVANLSLPCGSKVSFFYGGRVLQAVVDDRGPYVSGRTWDLDQNTAAALGLSGVATVWSSR